MKIRGKLRRERCRRPRGKNRTGIEERPHDPTSSALQWRRHRLRCVRPRSKAAGDVRCTKSIMRVTMATAQPPTDAAPQHQFMIWKGPSLSIGRASRDHLVGSNMNATRDHDRDSSYHSPRTRICSPITFPQMKGESASYNMSR